MSLTHLSLPSPSCNLQTLRTPIVDFPILQLVPNPTGKLLAIVGSHQLAVIVLPRPGYVNLVSPLLDCRCVVECPLALPQTPL